MTKYAIVKNGVVDVISFDPDREKVSEFEEMDGQIVEVGWHWGDVASPWVPVPEDVFAGFIAGPDNTWLPPEPHSVEEALPFEVSDRQFFQQLAVDGIITEEEALLAVGPGTIPSAMLSLIQQLPSDMRFDAKMKVTGATRFEPLNSLSLTIQQLFGWDEAQAKQFWIAASKL
jgi:hypothetical protein